MFEFGAADFADVSFAAAEEDTEEEQERVDLPAGRHHAPAVLDAERAARFVEATMKSHSEPSPTPVEPCPDAAAGNRAKRGELKRAIHMVEEEDLFVSFADPAHAAEVFNHAGVCVFPDGAMDAAETQQCRTEFEAEFVRIKSALAAQQVDEQAPFFFNEVCSRMPGRYDVRGVGVPGRGSFDLAEDAEEGAQPAPAPWSDFIHRVLGDQAVELWRGVVNNSFGSQTQRWHRDGECLWNTAGHLPAHCITVFVPLVDVTGELGPTGFYPGSHDITMAHRYEGVWEQNLAGQLGASSTESYRRCPLPTCEPLVAAGGAVAFDYRVVHRGTGNTGSVCGGHIDRPVLYFVYAAPWFHDTINFPEDSPLFAETETPQ
jgi:hypothetical protein